MRGGDGAGISAMVSAGAVSDSMVMVSAGGIACADAVSSTGATGSSGGAADSVVLACSALVVGGGGGYRKRIWILGCATIGSGLCPSRLAA